MKKYEGMIYVEVLISDRQYGSMVTTRLSYILMHAEVIWTSLVKDSPDITLRTLERFLMELKIEPYIKAFHEVRTFVQEEEQKQRYKLNSMLHFDFILICLYEFIERQYHGKENRDRKLCALLTLQDVRNDLYLHYRTCFQEGLAEELICPKLEDMGYDFEKRSPNEIGVQDNDLIRFMAYRTYPDV